MSHFLILLYPVYFQFLYIKTFKNLQTSNILIHKLWSYKLSYTINKRMKAVFMELDPVGMCLLKCFADEKC